MWHSLKKRKPLRRLFRKRNEAGERRFDPECSEERFEHEHVEERFDPEPVEPAQEPIQDVREPAAEPGVGLYENQAENKCRSDVISHAIRCLTTERHTSACVQRGHVRRVWQQLQESEANQAFFHPRVIESIEAEISQWEILHESKIRSRKPSDLTVCYLGGNNPVNDLQVLVDNGVLPQNVWAVQNDSETFESAREDNRESRLRNVRLFKGDVLNFLKDYEGNFDIVYLDACARLGTG